MVEWTDFERKAILSLWKKINVEEIGPLAMRRYHTGVHKQSIIRFYILQIVCCVHIIR